MDKKIGKIIQVWIDNINVGLLTSTGRMFVRDRDDRTAKWVESSIPKVLEEQFGGEKKVDKS